jgi:hypothetical protein
MAERTKKAFAIREFKDAGSERTYAASTAGKPETFHDIEEGSFANFHAAGLVREPTAEDRGTKPAA